MKPKASKRPSRFLDVLTATHDSARCPVCGEQQTITGPLRRVVPPMTNRLTPNTPYGRVFGLFRTQP